MSKITKMSQKGVPNVQLASLAVIQLEYTWTSGVVVQFKRKKKLWFFGTL